MAEAETGSVRPSAEVALNDVPAGTATRTQVLIGAEDGAPNFAMRRFVMGHGGGMPRHTNAVEHEQYVLKGRARVTIGNAVHEVKADDAVYIPAGVPHSYEVIDEPFEFLCMVPNLPDAIEILPEE